MTDKCTYELWIWISHRIPTIKYSNQFNIVIVFEFQYRYLKVETYYGAKQIENQKWLYTYITIIIYYHLC